MSSDPEKNASASSSSNPQDGVPSNSSKAKDAVERALDAMKPMAGPLTFGGIMGYCSGMALKKVGKAVAFVVGLGFVGLQAAAYAGYIELKWEKIGKDSIIKPLDTTGDGKLDLEDVKMWWQKVKKILTHQLPDAAGFSVGFLMGVKYG